MHGATKDWQSFVNWSCVVLKRKSKRNIEAELEWLARIYAILSERNKRICAHEFRSIDTQGGLIKQDVRLRMLRGLILQNLNMVL